MTRRRAAPSGRTVKSQLGPPPANASRRPSGDQAGSLSQSVTCGSRRTAVPSRRMIASRPCRWKARNLPLGDHAGPDSLARPAGKAYRTGVRARLAAPSRSSTRPAQPRNHVDREDTDPAVAMFHRKGDPTVLPGTPPWRPARRVSGWRRRSASEPAEALRLRVEIGHAERLVVGATTVPRRPHVHISETPQWRSWETAHAAAVVT